MSYQVGTFVPYWLKRYVLMDKTARLPPLYHFEEEEEVTAAPVSTFEDEKKEKV
jgi:hypothetical protein